MKIGHRSFCLSVLVVDGLLYCTLFLTRAWNILMGLEEVERVVLCTDLNHFMFIFLRIKNPLLICYFYLFILSMAFQISQWAFWSAYQPIVDGSNTQLYCINSNRNTLATRNLSTICEPGSTWLAA